MYILYCNDGEGNSCRCCFYFVHLGSLAGGSNSSITSAPVPNNKLDNALKQAFSTLGKFNI